MACEIICLLQADKSNHVEKLSQGNAVLQFPVSQVSKKFKMLPDCSKMHPLPSFVGYC